MHFNFRTHTHKLTGKTCSYFCTGCRKKSKSWRLRGRRANADYAEAAKGLLIFDNVNTHDALKNCWPASKHGEVLETTRDVLVASLPIDHGFEVNEFDIEDGAKFLLHMARNRKSSDDGVDASKEVAKVLGGLPLALNQMAALINARNCSNKEFPALYARYNRQLHKQKKSGWKYLGYQNSLDTVWEMSFKTIGSEAHACLGVLSFLSTDSVPSEGFTPTESYDLPSLLALCKDELRYEINVFLRIPRSQQIAWAMPSRN